MVTTRRSSKNGRYGGQQPVPIVNDAAPPSPPPGQGLAIYGDPTHSTHSSSTINQTLPSDSAIVDAFRGIRQSAAREKQKKHEPNKVSKAPDLDKESAYYRQLLTPERHQVDKLHGIANNGDTIASVEEAVNVINLPHFHPGSSSKSSSKRNPSTRNRTTGQKSAPAKKKKKRAPPKPTLRPRKKVLLPSEIAKASPVTAAEAAETIRRRAATMKALTFCDTTTLSRAHSSPAVLLVTPKACGSMTHRDRFCSSKRKLSYLTTIDSQIASAATRWEQKRPHRAPRSISSIYTTKTTGVSVTTTLTDNDGKMCGEQPPKPPVPIYSPPALVRITEGETTAPPPTASAIPEEDMGQPLSESMLASLFAWTELSPNMPPIDHHQNHWEEQRIQVVSSPLVAPNRHSSTGMTPLSDPSIADDMGYSQDELHNILFQLDDDDISHGNVDGNDIFRNDTANLTPKKSKAHGMTEGDSGQRATTGGRYFDVQPDTPLSFGAAYAGASSAIHGGTTNAHPNSPTRPAALLPIKTTLSQDMADLFGLESPI